MILGVFPLYLLVFYPLLAAPNPRVVGWRIAGAFLALLGVAAVLPEWSTLAQAPATFVAVSAGFAIAGSVLLIFSDIFLTKEEKEKRRSSPAEPMRRLAEGASVLPLIVSLGPLLRAGGWRGAVAAAGVLGSGAVIVTLLEFARVGKVWRWLDHRRLTRWTGPSSAIFPIPARTSAIAAAFLFLVALFVQHFAVAALCIAAGTLLIHDALRPLGKVPRWGLQPFIVLVALVAATWLIKTIAGAEIPLTVNGLHEAPFSAAAEMTLAPILGLAAWALLGLWPLHGTGPASALSILGGLLLIRWGNGIIPTGMEHMAPVAGIVAVLAAMHGASLRRSGELSAALGVLAVVPSGAGAWPFFVLGGVPATLWILEKKTVVLGLDRHQVVGVLLIPALAYALPTMLRGETVLTVVAVIAGVVLFLPTSPEQRTAA